MRRPGLRLLMAAIGLTLLVFYAVAAYLLYRLAVAVWLDRPDWTAALVLVAGLTLVVGYLSYRFGTARLLASLDAAPLSRTGAPEVHRRADGIVGAMDVSRPRPFVAQMGVPDALAVGSGRDGALVIDRRLFRLLDADELEAVVADELAHLESGDSLVQTLAYSFVRTVAGFVVVLLAPVAWVLAGLARATALLAGRPASWPSNPLGRLQALVTRVVLALVVVTTMLVLAHSRRREFAADERAVEVTGEPRALASALAKIERASEPGWGLLSPLYVRGDEEGPLTRWFSSHPPTEERIERLRRQATAEGT